MTRDKSILLGEAERILAKYSPATFDGPDFGFAKCIEYARAVEDEEAWKARYTSLGAFYAAHEARHPDIRLYGVARRETMTENPLTSPGGRPSEPLGVQQS